MRRSDDDFAREIEAHLAIETDRLIADGVEPSAARDLAVRRFGNATSVRERYYESRRLLWLEHVRQDVRYAITSYLRTPGFTAVVVATLALGIGATTAIFSVVNAVLLRPLPYADDRIVRIVETAPTPGSAAPRRGSPLGVVDVARLRERAPTLSHVGIHIPVFWTLTEGGESMHAVGARVSPAILAALDVRPVLGRLFEEKEEQAGHELVIVLSHAMWRQRYGASADVLGRTVMLESKGYVVVGVMPPDFRFPDASTDYWVPFVVPASGPRAQQRLPLTARIKDGVSIDAAASEIATLLPEVRTDAQPNNPAARLELIPLLDLVITPVQPALSVLAGAVGFVPLIACANVASLLLARGRARRRELAVRAALGAGRARLVAQALTESLLLASIGGAAGLALAFGGVQLLQALAGSLSRRDLGPTAALPRLDEVGIDASVWMFTLLISLVTGIVFGLVPALRAGRLRAPQVLRDGPNASASGFNLLRGQHVHGLLLVGEVSMAVVLLVGGGLLIHSFVNLSRVDLGFVPDNVLTFQLSLPPNRGEQELTALGELVAERLRSTPGVVAAGYTESLPMIPSGRMVPLRRTPELPPLRGAPPAPGAFPPDVADGRVVSRDYPQAMGIRIIEGRTFVASDRLGQPRALLINRRLARSGLLGDRPLSQQIYGFGREPWQVVGIFDDVRQFSVGADPQPQVLMDMRQVAEPLNLSLGLYFAVRLEGSMTPLASTVRGAVRQIDSQAIVEHHADE
jgi:putative ABC transport system permease protein